MTSIRENRVPLYLLIRAFQISRMIRLVADFGIADSIPSSGGCHVHKLAAAHSIDPAQLLRVLRALAAFDIFRVNVDGEVFHSPLSMRLRKDASDSLYYAARFFAAPGPWKAWGELDTALRGNTPFDVACGISRFDYLRSHPDEARIYDSFLAHFPDNTHNAIAATYDFSRATLIVDIGGGNGEALRKILSVYSNPRGLVFDRGDVVEAIPPSALLGGRIKVQAGNFFKEVPKGADLYLLVRVLHNWPDEECIQILRAVRAAMEADSRLLIADHIIEPDPRIGNPLMYLLDIQMMALYGRARERTEAEFDKLLADSGLKPVRAIPTESPVSIIEVVAD